MWFAVLCVALSLVPSVHAASYTFTLLEEHQSPIGILAPFATINSAGHVAYWVQPDPGNVALAIQFHGGVSATISAAALPNETGGTLPGPYQLRTDAPLILTDSGSVAFVEANSGSIFTADAVNGLQFVGQFSPLVPDITRAADGSVVLATSLGTTQALMLVTDPDTFTIRLMASESLPFNAFPTAPDINTAGTMAFRGQGPGWLRGIYTVDASQTVTPILQDDTVDALPTINSAGHVAFLNGTLFPQEIRFWDGDTLHTIADTSGGYANLGADPTSDRTLNPFAMRGVALNDSDTVAFWALRDDGRQGIFTGPDPDDDVVAQDGDIILGHVVQSEFDLPLTFSRHALNNAGQLVLVLQRHNNGFMVVRADPVPLDDDGDGVANVADACPNTVIPEPVPTVALHRNRYALVDGNRRFDTPAETPAPKRFTLKKTAGCSCTQILAALGLSPNQTQYGCRKETLQVWIAGH